MKHSLEMYTFEIVQSNTSTEMQSKSLKTNYRSDEFWEVLNFPSSNYHEFDVDETCPGNPI